MKLLFNQGIFSIDNMPAFDEDFREVFGNPVPATGEWPERHHSLQFRKGHHHEINA